MITRFPALRLLVTLSVIKSLFLHPLSGTSGTISSAPARTQPKAKVQAKEVLPGKPADSRAVTPLEVTRTFVYTNFRGLHARPAALLVKYLSGFKCSVVAQCNGEPANAKSILGLLCLAVGCQSKVTFTATGPDAPEAMAAIERLFERQFDEAY